MEQLRKPWLLLLLLALFVAGPIAWYKWSGPAAANDEASRPQAPPPESAGAVHEGKAGFGAESLHGSRGHSHGRVHTRGEEACQGAVTVRGSDHQAPGGDRLRESAACLRSVEGELSN